MKKLAIAASMLGVILTAAPVPAQQKLGDVAGSIKLKKTGEGNVVIDGSDVGQTSRRGGASAGSGQLYDILTDCLEVSRELSSVVADAPRISPVRYTAEWTAQIEAFGQQLESLGRELQMQPDAGPAEAAYQKAVAGFDQVRQGYEAVLSATTSRRLVATPDKRTISDGADAIEAAMSEMRSVDRTESARSAPPPIDPIAAASSIRRICGRVSAEGSPAFSDCVAKQDAAKNALVARTAPAVGLDTASFNKIRNGCLFEWPDNYVNRNACETRRAAAASK